MKFRNSCGRCIVYLAIVWINWKDHRFNFVYISVFFCVHLLKNVYLQSRISENASRLFRHIHFFFNMKTLHCSRRMCIVANTSRFFQPCFAFFPLLMVFFLHSQANWFKAAQYCRFHGMHLASISSQEENDKLEKYVRDSGTFIQF